MKIILTYNTERDQPHEGIVDLSVPGEWQDSEEYAESV
jgi:hypothetical protein